MGSTTHPTEELLIARICDTGVQLVPQEQRYTFSSTDQVTVSDVQKFLLAEGYRLDDWSDRNFEVFDMTFRQPGQPETNPVILRFVADGKRLPVALCYHWQSEHVQITAQVNGSNYGSTWDYDADATRLLYDALTQREVDLGGAMLSYGWIPVTRGSVIAHP